MSSPVAELLAVLSTALERLGIRWYLFGAQAVLLYGGGRLTADVDVTVALGDRPVAEVLASLAATGFTSRIPDIEDFVARTRVLPLVHDVTGIPVDLIVAGEGPEDAFMSRARPRSIEGVSVPVAAPEDMIAMKVLAGRPKDVDDVAAMLAARRAGLDLALVRSTLAQFEAALDRRDLLPVLETVLARVDG